MENEVKQEFHEEIKQMQQLAQNITAGQIPLILTMAMAGKKIQLDQLQNGSVVACEESNADSEPVVGIILSKEQLIKIEQYVKYGLMLPTDEPSVRAAMPYTDPDTNNTTLQTANYMAINALVSTHAKEWSGLRKRIKTLGVDLNIFGKNFVTTGTEIMEVIDAMPVTQRMRETVGGSTIAIPFTDEDVEYKLVLKELLGFLKTRVTVHLTATTSLCQTLSLYSTTMDNVIVPRVSVLANALHAKNLTKVEADLLNDKEEKQKEIDLQDKIYSKMTGLAFTGAAGMAIPIIGVITWAITGGIFGKKAEDARKARNKAKDELAEIEKKINLNDAAMKSVTSMTKNIDNAKIIVNEAIVGVRNLETLWLSVAKYIEDAKTGLDSITDSTRLTTFNLAMKSSVSSWTEVKDMTGELVRLFEQVEKEIATT